MRVAAPDLGWIARVVQRLAVLLAAGVAPTAAWDYLREGELPAGVAARCRGGTPVPEAIVETLPAPTSGSSPGEQVVWRALAVAWAVATDVGAPLAPTLRDFAHSLRELAQAQREIAAALAAPTATARLVLALPLVGMAFGMLLGFDTVGTLVTTPVGWACLAVGGGLMFGASRWNRRLVRRARPRELTPGLGLDLLAIAVSGGGSLDRARESVAVSVSRFAGDGSLTDPEVEGILGLSVRAGVPAAELLRSEATERRRDARADASARAQELAVRLMIPLGVCVLPAFMILTVVPLLVAVLRQTSPSA